MLRSRGAAILCMALVGLFSFAAASVEKPIWYCTLAIEASGNPWYFLRSGHDAWEGPGVLECINREQHRQIRVKARYEAWSPGYGADKKSRLSLWAVNIDLPNPEGIFRSYPAAVVGQDTVFFGLKADAVVQVGEVGYGFELGIRSGSTTSYGASLDYGTLTILPQTESAQGRTVFNLDL